MGWIGVGSGFLGFGCSCIVGGCCVWYVGWCNGVVVMVLGGCL